MGLNHPRFYPLVARLSTLIPTTRPHIHLASITMSFGFGIGDIVLVSGAAVNLYTAIRDAPVDQQSLMIEVEMMRQLLLQITIGPTPVSPLAIAGSAAQGPQSPSAAAAQFSRCFQLLQNLDTIAAKYIGNSLSLQSPVTGKKARSRVFRWGLYKRREFAGLLGDLRNMIHLLYMLQQNGNQAPAQMGSPSSVSHIELTDALDRSWVCSFEHCSTYEVSRGQY